MPVIDKNGIAIKTGSIYPAPYDLQMKGRSSISLGDAGGLTQFGVKITILEPGARSSLRHWHQNEDEFVMIMKGEVTLRLDEGDTILRVGDCAAFPAGLKDGHCLINHTDIEARFLVVGTRCPHEYATYTDVDLKVEMKNGNATFTRKDGSPYQPPAEENTNE